MAGREADAGLRALGENPPRSRASIARALGLTPVFSLGPGENPTRAPFVRTRPRASPLGLTQKDALLSEITTLEPKAYASTDWTLAELRNLRDALLQRRSNPATAATIARAQADESARARALWHPTPTPRRLSNPLLAVIGNPPEVTRVNLSALATVFGRADVVSARMDASHIHHLRRCLAAGLLVPEGKNVRLTPAGREAVDRYLASLPPPAPPSHADMLRLGYGVGDQGHAESRIYLAVRVGGQWVGSPATTLTKFEALRAVFDDRARAEAAARYHGGVVVPVVIGANPSHGAYRMRCRTCNRARKSPRCPTCGNYVCGPCSTPRCRFCVHWEESIRRHREKYGPNPGALPRKRLVNPRADAICPGYRMVPTASDAMRALSVFACLLRQARNTALPLHERYLYAMRAHFIPFMFEPTRQDLDAQARAVLEQIVREPQRCRISGRERTLLEQALAAASSSIGWDRVDPEFFAWVTEFLPSAATGALSFAPQAPLLSPFQNPGELVPAVMSGLAGGVGAAVATHALANASRSANPAGRRPRSDEFVCRRCRGVFVKIGRKASRFRKGKDDICNDCEIASRIETSLRRMGLSRGNPDHAPAKRGRRYTQQCSLRQGPLALARALPAYTLALKRFRLFHRAEPSGVSIIRIPDGRREVTRKIGVALGVVPETVYETPWKSNKHGPTWVHKHPRGRAPLEVLDPITNVTSKLGPITVSDWWRR